MSLAAPFFALVAGEASGDLLAEQLLQGLLQRWPGLTAAGIGGSRMRQCGFDAWWPSDKLAVRGYVEVLRHYRDIVGIRKQLGQRLLQQRPDLFIGVDAPDFNLMLEAKLRAAGVPTAHFICPSIWAWRPERVDLMRKSCSHVLCIFPFEVALLERHGIAATYVGHPLAQVIPLTPDRAAARAVLGLAPDARVLAILPGSRASEVQYLAERFFSAAVLIKRSFPAIECIVPTLPALCGAVEAAAQRVGLGSDLRLLDGQSHAALAACDVTLIASGTATLEAALFKRPMVIAYNMHWLSWQLMRRKQLQPWVGLPNILCEDFVVPELIQDAATPEALATAVLQWLNEPAHALTLHKRFTELHLQLRRDTPRLATDAIQNLLKC